jgi:lipopolysaccharide biosynthesis glycosyltransferase
MAPKSKAVVTIVVGSYAERMAQATNPFMRAYANKCDAEFIVLQIPRFQHLGQLYYEKFQLYSLFEKYERILYLDNDVLVSPLSPDLFELTPADHFAACAEETWSRFPECKRAILAELGDIPWNYPYFNAGVMLASHSQREVFNPAHPALQRWATDHVRQRYPYQGDDQTYFNYRVNELQLPMIDHGFRFNHTRSISQTHTRFSSYFIHYAGPCGHRYGDRLEQIEKDSRAMASPAILALSRSSHAFRWLADRLDLDFVNYLLRKRN